MGRPLNLQTGINLKVSLEKLEQDIPNTSFCTLKALQEFKLITTQTYANNIYHRKQFVNIHTHKKKTFHQKSATWNFSSNKAYVFPSANSSQGYWLLLILIRIAQIELTDSFSSRHSSHMKRNHCN